MGENIDRVKEIILGVGRIANRSLTIGEVLTDILTLIYFHSDCQLLVVLGPLK